MSAYLKKTITAIVFAMSVGHAVEGYANNSSTDRQRDLETIYISLWDNPYDIAASAFNWSLEDYAAWESGPAEETGGGGSGGDDPPLSTTCSDLRQNKPANCPNPIPLPVGYSYGRDQYPSGTALPKLIYWIDFVGGVSPDAREFARQALAVHTTNLTNEFVPVQTANEWLLLSVQTACHLQHVSDTNNPWVIGTSHMEQRCLEIAEMLGAEARNEGFANWLVNWLQREGIHLDDLGIPETFLSSASANSLKTKETTVGADTKCAKWWAAAQANHCTP